MKNETKVIIKKNIIEQENGIFPTRLRKLIEKKQISQKELGDAIGITRQSISLYTMGQRTPDIDVLKNLCEYFNVSADYLVGLAEVETRDMDIKEISKKTGLSEEAIHAIEMIREWDHFSGINYFNFFISSRKFNDLLILIRRYTVNYVAEFAMQERFLKKYNDKCNLGISEDKLLKDGEESLDSDKRMLFYTLLEEQKKNNKIEIDNKYDLYKINDKINDVLFDIIVNNRKEIELSDDVQIKLELFEAKTDEEVKKVIVKEWKKEKEAVEKMQEVLNKKSK